MKRDIPSGTRICFSNNNGSLRLRYGVVLPASPPSASYLLVRLQVEDKDEEGGGQLPLFTVVPDTAHIIVCEF